MSYKILIINPGSTSTKIGVYEDETQLMEETLRHSTEEIAKYDTIYDQKDFRKEVILDVLKEKNVDLNDIDVVVGRGGLLKPIPGGTYATTPELLEDLKVGKQGQHRCIVLCVIINIVELYCVSCFYFIISNSYVWSLAVYCVHPTTSWTIIKFTKSYS